MQAADSAGHSAAADYLTMTRVFSPQNADEAELFLRESLAASDNELYAQHLAQSGALHVLRMIVTEQMRAESIVAMYNSATYFGAKIDEELVRRGIAQIGVERVHPPGHA